MSARDWSVVSFVKRKLRELKVTNDYGLITAHKLDWTQQVSLHCMLAVELLHRLLIGCRHSELGHLVRRAI